MVQKLLRVTDESTRHKVLDLIFLAAFGIGLVNTVNAWRALEAGQNDPGVWLLVLHMAIFSLSGALGYYAHLTQRIWWEFPTIIPIIAGYITVLLGSVMTQTTGEIPDPFFISMGGLLPSVALWFIIDATDRFIIIDRRRKQLRKSVNAREAAAQPTDPKDLIAKAAEIQKSRAEN